MPTKKKIKWEVISARGVDHHFELTEQLVKPFANGSFSRAHRTKFTFHFYRQLDGCRSFDADEMKQFRKILQRYIENKPGVLIELGGEYERRFLQLRRFINKTAKLDFKKKTNKELFAIYKKYFDLAAHRWSYAYTYMFLNQLMSEELSSLAHSHVSKHCNYGDMLKQFTAPIKSNGLIRLREKLQQLNKRKHSTKERNLHLKRLLDEYQYLGYYGWRGKPFSIKDLKVLMREPAKEQVKCQVKLSRKEQLFVKIVKTWIYAANESDELWGYSRLKLEPLWQEIARRFRISIWDVGNMRYIEMKETLLSGQLTPVLRKDLKERVKDSLYEFINGKVQVVTGEKLVEIKKQEVKKEKIPQRIKKLTGQTASLGKARGKVQVILSADRVNKMRKGNILVTVMTTPAYVPAMQKAAAIVTDEGGLLSHAAVVSREMGKPAVIGTKIGTKVFKDGDKVEVNADKGVVKKI